MVDLTSIIGKYGVAGVIIIIIIYYLLHPEKFEKLSALLYKLLSKVYSAADKKYIKHDIQGSVNNFVVNKLKNEIKDFEAPKLKVEWIDENQTAEEFISKGKLVIRMKKSQDQDENIVRASVIYISKSLLTKAKVYLSPKQKESINLHTARVLLQSERREIAVKFVENYLLNKNNSDEKIRKYLSMFHNIDKAGMFFPILIQELNFLGEKVFGENRDRKIIEETNKLITFLEAFSKREVGDDSTRTDFYGEYMSLGIVLIGKKSVVQIRQSTPYVKLCKRLIETGVHTLYLVGDIENKDIITQTAEEVLSDEFDLYNEKEYEAEVNLNGGKMKVRGYLIVIRKKIIDIYYDQTS